MLREQRVRAPLWVCVWDLRTAPKRLSDQTLDEKPPQAPTCQHQEFTTWASMLTGVKEPRRVDQLSDVTDGFPFYSEAGVKGENKEWARLRASTTHIISRVDV